MIELTIDSKEVNNINSEDELKEVKKECEHKNTKWTQGGEVCIDCHKYLEHSFP